MAENHLYRLTGRFERPTDPAELTDFNLRASRTSYEDGPRPEEGPIVLSYLTRKPGQYRDMIERYLGDADWEVALVEPEEAC